MKQGKVEFTPGFNSSWFIEIEKGNIGHLFDYMQDIRQTFKTSLRCIWLASKILQGSVGKHPE